MEYLKLIKPLFEEISKEITQHIAKGFELMASQMGSKEIIIRDSGSSQSVEKKTMGEHIFLGIGPHNRPHEFHTIPRPTAPKFFIPK